MARIAVLGAGISGHTAALHLRRKLGREHTITVVSPNTDWNWIPSNIWVGVGKMKEQKVVFPLTPIYKRKGIEFKQARAVALWPEGDADDPAGAVDIIYTDPAREGETERIRYDYVINATGPKLNFGATPGLGPEAGGSASVCTAPHAVDASNRLHEAIERLKRGERQTFLVGMGHGTCTCEGAAFEYTFNVDHALREAGVRDLAEVVYITNENELGDFGVGGMIFQQRGFQQPSKIWAESLYRERGVRAILGAHVTKVEPNTAHYELLDGSEGSVDFDFAMLLPPFRGNDWKAFDREGADITDKVFAPSGFMKVDADYTPKGPEQWRADDWPRTYESPDYPNVFAVGIAFAPPHPISTPRKSPNGTVITPSPPRTGMPSGMMGRTVAFTIADRIKTGDPSRAYGASMATMGAACVASTGPGLTSGSAAAMTMFPIVPDHERYPATGGRSISDTFGEIGLGAHWVKLMLHYLFIYKAKARPGWFLLPE